MGFFSHIFVQQKFPPSALPSPLASQPDRKIGFSVSLSQEAAEVTQVPEQVLTPCLNCPIFPEKITMRTTSTIRTITAIMIVFRLRPWAFLFILDS